MAPIVIRWNKLVGRIMVILLLFLSSWVTQGVSRGLMLEQIGSRGLKHNARSTFMTTKISDSDDKSTGPSIGSSSSSNKLKAAEPSVGDYTESTVCPEISLTETSLMVRVDRMPGFWYYEVQVKTECTSRGEDDSDIEAYNPVFTPLSSAYLVTYGGRRYVRVSPNEVVASLSCGEILTCRHSLVARSPWGEEVSSVVSQGSCEFDYRNFIQWGYRQTGVGYTCSEGALMYTLMCVECQFEDFDWDLAYNMSGPFLDRSGSGRTFNYVMVIVAVSVVGFAVLVAFGAMVVRNRRRAAINGRVSEMVSRVNADRDSQGSRKSPELFTVGDEDGAVEIDKEYTGPIVVKYESIRDDGDFSGESTGPEAEGAEVDLNREMGRTSSKKITNWTMTQIAVLDPDAPEEDAGDDSYDDDDEEKNHLEDDVRHQEEEGTHQSNPH
jgi:hypothetical protein